MSRRAGLHKIYIGNKLFCEYPYYIAYSQYGPPKMEHEAYFCPVCGDIWARRLEGNHMDSEWSVTPRACVTHGDGSLFAAVEKTLSPYFLLQWPKIFLAREFLIMYDDMIGDR